MSAPKADRSLNAMSEFFFFFFLLGTATWNTKKGRETPGMLRIFHKAPCHDVGWRKMRRKHPLGGRGGGGGDGKKRFVRTKEKKKPRSRTTRT